MARVTRRPCRVAGCPDAAERLGRCEPHAAEVDARQRRTVPTKRVRTYAVQQRRARVVADHRATHGDWCPGHGVRGHPATDLTADDVVPVARTGHGDGALAVLCRSCNARKGSS